MRRVIGQVMGEPEPETGAAAPRSPLRSPEDCVRELGDFSAGRLAQLGANQVATGPARLTHAAVAPQLQGGTVLTRGAAQREAFAATFAELGAQVRGSDGLLRRCLALYVNVIY